MLARCLPDQDRRGWGEWTAPACWGRSAQGAGAGVEVVDKAGVKVEAGGEQPVTLGPRAWPLIDMLERTAKGGAQANIVWEAAPDF